MVTEPNDKWSYGVSAEPEPEVVWPPPAGADAGVADMARLSSGRWTSPSLGAYDPSASTAPDITDFDYNQPDNGYFDDYGHGEDYGDGSLHDGSIDGSPHDGSDEGSLIELGDEFGEADDDELEAGGNARRNAIEWAVVLVGAVLLALILRAVLLQAFWIPSPSMESTLLVKDRVLVNKVSYRLHDINRGDVIVFRRTDDEIARNPELPRDVIKRVIALEGETIAIADNTVTIDGVELREPYLDSQVITSDFGPEVVPEGHVFVMGDNRELSLDSRFETGPISHDRVVGRAFFLFWPLDRLGSL